MKISQQQLRKIIMEEMAAHKQSQMLQEGTSGNPLKVTSEYLNALIQEEYAAYQRKQQLAESRRRQRASQYKRK